MAGRGRVERVAARCRPGGRPSPLNQPAAALPPEHRRQRHDKEPAEDGEDEERQHERLDDRWPVDEQPKSRQHRKRCLHAECDVEAGGAPAEEREGGEREGCWMLAAAGEAGRAGRSRGGAATGSLSTHHLSTVVARGLYSVTASSSRSAAGGRGDGADRRGVSGRSGQQQQESRRRRAGLPAARAHRPWRLAGCRARCQRR